MMMTKQHYQAGSVLAWNNNTTTYYTASIHGGCDKLAIRSSIDQVGKNGNSHRKIEHKTLYACGKIHATDTRAEALPLDGQNSG
ncbi:hypothetical protein DPMN_154661 [Dreissena polymorpha]|uniref:Uncharacterized protein n=1 Tax=Dreissena polymorpha TaxID=45954 RepID=A0A9D4FS80_DREPO|nr:hypothetical protein DPMN_154661 [Dreissena polymorpha]